MKLVILYYYVMTLLLSKPQLFWLVKKLKTFRLKQLRKKLKKINSYYHQNNYPIVNKQIMMENFDKFNTVGVKKEEALEIALKAEKDKTLPVKDDVTIGLSTGTSGNRGIFLATPMERAKWAGLILAKLLPYSIFKKQSICLFLRNNSELYETINSKNLSFIYFSLSTSWSENIERLVSENPNTIVAPPSVLVKIANEFEAKNIFITPIKIISAAEVLTPEDRTYIEKIFKLTLHEVYQCTEGFLAASCSHGNLHINEDFINIEKKWLNDEKTRFSPIITDTLRTSLPIINYELNDILNISTLPCPCGSKFLQLSHIEGRCDDIFKFGNTEIFPDYIRRTIICTSDKIQEYRLTQLSSIKIELELLPFNRTLSNLVINRLETFLKSYGVREIQILSIPMKTPSPENKIRRIISKV